MLTIQLPDRDPRSWQLFYVKDKLVRPRATGVVFLDDRHIVATDLMGCCFYVFQIDMSSLEATLLHRGDTVEQVVNETQAGGNPGSSNLLQRLLARLARAVARPAPQPEEPQSTLELCWTDLLDFNGKDLLLTSNMWQATQTLYKIEGHRIEYLKTVPRATAERKFCHGAAFHPTQHGIIGTANFDVSQVEIVDYEREKLLLLIPFPQGVKPKDLTWINDNHLMVAHTTSDVVDHATDHIPRSGLALYRIEADYQGYQLVAEEFIEDSHSDAVIFCDGLVFTGNQPSGEIHIYRLFQEGNAPCVWRFTHVASLGGYPDPHGIAFHKDTGLLAVTNYGDNTVRICPVPDEVLALIPE